MVAYTAVTVLAGILPVPLLAQERVFMHASRLGGRRAPAGAVNRTKREERSRTVDQWQHRLGDPRIPDRVTIEAIRPLVQRWLGRRHGGLSFRLTQVLAGHGCFGEYLCRIRKKRTTRCHHCGAASDSAHHTLVECESWAVERGMLAESVSSHSRE